MDGKDEAEAMVTLADIERARELLRGITVETPVLPSDRLSAQTGARVFVKAENTQRAGSFKLRGAYTRLASLTPEQRGRGVVAASMGNHAQGVALGAKIMGIESTVVMPSDAPLTKVTATRRYGANVVLTGNSFDDAAAHSRELVDQHGLALVHAFDDPAVITGQGTVGLELFDALPDIDTVIVPIGGGGLISGISLALHARKPGTRIVGVQAHNCSTIPDSLIAGEPVMVHSARTIADGIAVKCPGGHTLPIIRDHVDHVVTVDETEIARAIVFTFQHMGLLVEGAGAVGVAALMTSRIHLRPDETACIILSGANIDPNLLTRVIDQTLTQDGRYLVVRTSVPDRPGNLAALTQQIAAAGANVIDIHHRRSVWGVPLDHTGLELILEVRDATHGHAVLTHLNQSGYVVARVGGEEFPS